MHVNLYKDIEKKKTADGHLLALSIGVWLSLNFVCFIDQSNTHFSRKRKVGKIKMIKLSFARKTLPVTLYAEINIPELHKYQ